MSRIRGKDTGPELAVRDILRRLRYRIDLYRTDLPGKPDIVLPRRHVVVLVHGCFWHRHKGCRFAYNPKSNLAFWRRKFESNVKRDRQVRLILRKAGWKTIVVWECQLKKADRLKRRLQRLLRAS